MARARNIKPGFFTNDALAEATPIARILFAGLWCFADREGRMHDRPKKIKAEILPYDECNVDELLNSLAALGFVIRYEVAGAKYIQVVNFDKHQNPHVKEQASEIPAPCMSGANLVQESNKPDECMEVAGLIPSSLIPDSLNLIPDSNKKPTAQKHRLDFHADAFEEFWQVYPSRPGSSKSGSLKAWKARIKDGADPQTIIQGAANYSAYCVATEIAPNYIKQPVTFLGPDKHYESDWTAPTRASPKMSHSDASKLSAARAIFGTEIEGQNGNGRIIEASAAFTGSVDRQDFPRIAR